MLKRFVLSFMIGLIVSFFLTNPIAIACYQYAYPHDGQSGLAAFALELYVAPPLGIAAFAIYFFASRKRFVSCVDK